MANENEQYQNIHLHPFAKHAAGMIKTCESKGLSKAFTWELLTTAQADAEKNATSAITAARMTARLRFGSIDTKAGAKRKAALAAKLNKKN